MAVNFITPSFSVKYLNTQNSVIEVKDPDEPLTNYEYEIKQNDNKRKILILKPQYLSVFVSDMRNIMKYTESSQYIDQKTIGTYNPNLTGI